MNFWIETLILTLRAPRKGLRQLLNLQRPPGSEILGLALVAVASTILIHLNILIMPQEERDLALQLFGKPFATAGIQFVVMVAASFLIYRVGKMRGGQGSFADSLLAMSWLQLVLFLLQLAQIVVIMILPQAAVIMGYVAIGLFFALLTHFTAELHGFRSVLAVFLGVVLTLLAVLILLSFVLSLFIDPEVLTHGL